MPFSPKSNTTTHGVQCRMGHAHLQMSNSFTVKQKAKPSHYCGHVFTTTTTSLTRVLPSAQIINHYCTCSGKSPIHLLALKDGCYVGKHTNSILFLLNVNEMQQIAFHKIQQVSQIMITQLTIMCNISPLMSNRNHFALVTLGKPLRKTQFSKIKAAITSSKWDKSSALQPYFQHRHHLTTQEGLILKERCLVIPKCQQHDNRTTSPTLKQKVYSPRKCGGQA